MKFSFKWTSPFTVRVKSDKNIAFYLNYIRPDHLEVIIPTETSYGLSQVLKAVIDLQRTLIIERDLNEGQ